MSKAVIAPATPSACGECARLLVNQLGEHGVEVSAERLMPVLESVVANPQNGFLLLARDGERIVGVAYVAIIQSMEHCGPVAWLEELYVTPAQRGQGIGTALLGAVLERAGEIGIVAVDLEVDAGHRRTEALYQRFGFRPLNRSRWVKTLKNP